MIRINADEFRPSTNHVMRYVKDMQNRHPSNEDAKLPKYIANSMIPRIPPKNTKEERFNKKRDT